MFTKVYGKAQFYATVGVIVGIVSSGIMVSFISIEIIALISATICFVNVIFALQIREKNFYSEQLDKKSTGLFDTFKQASVFIRGSGIAFISILFVVFFASLGGYLDEFDALIINDFQLSNVWASVILFVRFAFVALGDILAPLVQKKISSVKQIFLLNGVGCVLLLIFAAIWNLYALPIFGLPFMIMTITEILLVNALQNEIKEEGRATVMSFYGIGQNIAMICLSLVFALLAEILTLQQIYIITAIYALVGGLCFYLFMKTIKIKT